MLSNINELAQEVYRRNVEKGFYQEPKNIGEMIALLHSELSEALECDRKDRYANADNEIWARLDASPDKVSFADLFRETVKDTFEDEIADTFIRLLDVSGFLGIDIQRHIEYKMKYNETREFKHGKRY